MDGVEPNVIDSQKSPLIMATVNDANSSRTSAKLRYIPSEPTKMMISSPRPASNLATVNEEGYRYPVLLMTSPYLK